MKSSKPTKEIVHLQADSYFNSAIAAIDHAQQQIDLESYIFSDDPITSELINALVRAAQRRVRIRVMVDGVGINDDFLSIAKTLRKHGIQVRIYHPLPWQLKFWPLAITLNKGLRKLLYLILSINKRNHRKTLIIDKKHIWLGSFNVSQAHFSQEKNGGGWRDTGVELNHTNAAQVCFAFNLAWYRWHRFKKKPVIQDSAFLLNYSRKQRRYNQRRLFERLEQARSRIWITNAYFVPDSKLIALLVTASERGVDVRILVPQHSDVSFIPWITQYFYEELLSAGIRIFEYQPSMLHAKTLIVDDWATIGSSNFNRRSLVHDLEVDYVLQEERNLVELERSFIEDLSVSEEKTLKELSEHGFWKRILGKILLTIFGYWV